MSNHERGAYTPPTDAPLAFEARQPVRGARPFPLTLIVSVLVLFGLAAAIFVFYRSGVRQAVEGPQVVGTPVGGLKSPPPPEAQPQDPAAGLEIYRTEPGQPPQMVPDQPQFTAPPEQPQARPVGPPVVLAPAQAPAPQATPSQTPGAQTPPAQPELRPAQAAPSAAALPPAPAKPPALAATVTPPPRPAAAPKPAEKTAAEKLAEKKALDQAKAILSNKPAAPAKAGAAAVQIGAVASPALADKTWNEAVAIAPGLAAGRGKGVEKVEKDGKTLYRTSVTGFASRDSAAAFCAKLKAAGKACFVK